MLNTGASHVRQSIDAEKRRRSRVAVHNLVLDLLHSL